MHQRSDELLLCRIFGLGFHDVSRRALARGFKQCAGSELRGHTRRAVWR